MSKPSAPATIATGQFVRLMRDGRWEYVERTGVSGVVAVLAVTDDGSLVLTEQYRHPVQTRVIDLPAGLVGDIAGEETESPTAAARRELQEEAGFTAASFRLLATLPSSAGLTSETIELFQAIGIIQIGASGGDDSEQIVVHVVPLQRIADWLDEQVKQGRLVDPKVYTALWWHSRM